MPARLRRSAKIVQDGLKSPDKKGDVVADKLRQKSPEVKRRISAYEQRRLANIRANEELLASLNLLEIRDSLVKSHDRSIALKRLQRTPKEWKAKPRPEGPTRRSLRIRMKDRTFEELSEAEKLQFQKREEEQRKEQESKNDWTWLARPSGTLQASDYLESQDGFHRIEDKNEKAAITENALTAFCKSVSRNLANNGKNGTRGKLCSPDSNATDSAVCSTWNSGAKPEGLIQQISSLRLLPEGRVKMTKERLYSATFHPAVSNPAILAVGDKCGQIGLCLVDMSARPNLETPKSFQFRPHSSPVNALVFPDEASTSKLYSASYDGTVRVFDFERKVFDEMYREKDDLCKYLAFQSNDVLLIPLHSGNLVVKDIRKRRCEKHLLCNDRFRTIDCHPVDKNSFITASNKGHVDRWDLRMIGERKNTPVNTFTHHNSVSSAYFSPLTGNRILTASMGDLITVFQSDTTESKICTLKHNNHVGRWLTAFRPIWHPKSENVFLSGSMQQPRVVEVWNTDSINGGGSTNYELDNGTRANPSVKMGGLSSVCSVLALHKEFPILCGVNSSGYAHLWL